MDWMHILTMNNKLSCMLQTHHHRYKVECFAVSQLPHSLQVFAPRRCMYRKQRARQALTVCIMSSLLLCGCARQTEEPDDTASRVSMDPVIVNSSQQTSEESTESVLSESAHTSSEKMHEVIASSGSSESWNKTESHTRNTDKSTSDSSDVTGDQNSSDNDAATGNAVLQSMCDSIQAELLSSRQATGELWAVSCIDLSDGSSASVNGDAAMLSASDLKLFIMAALYEGVNNGAADASLESYVPDMITVSSNEAANAIVTGLGSGNATNGEQVINQYCQSHGYNATHMGRLFLKTPAGDDNYTSANDCARLLQQIYLGRCVSEDVSAQMVSYLKQQTRTGKIPAGITGTGAVTANKTGELAGNGLGYAENDCAIIYGTNKDYILCIFSNSLTSNSEAISTIQSISEKVWNTLE